MKLFLTVEDRNRVDMLNKILDTSYRTKPYDLNNPSDFVEALTASTAEYIDLWYYWDSVGQILDRLESNVRAYYPAKVNMMLSGEETEDGVVCAVNEVYTVCCALSDLAIRAKPQCQRLWHIALSYAPDEILDRVCGQVFRGNQEELAELLTFKFEYSKQIKSELWRYYTQQTAHCFGQALKEELDAMRLAKKRSK